jgi:hypothetical protein
MPTKLSLVLPACVLCSAWLAGGCCALGGCPDPVAGSGWQAEAEQRRQIRERRDAIRAQMDEHFGDRDRYELPPEALDRPRILGRGAMYEDRTTLGGDDGGYRSAPPPAARGGRRAPPPAPAGPLYGGDDPAAAASEPAPARSPAAGVGRYDRDTGRFVRDRDGDDRPTRSSPSAPPSRPAPYAPYAPYAPRGRDADVAPQSPPPPGGLFVPGSSGGR